MSKISKIQSIKHQKKYINETINILKHINSKVATPTLALGDKSFHGYNFKINNHHKPQVQSSRLNRPETSGRLSGKYGMNYYVGYSKDKEKQKTIQANDKIEKISSKSMESRQGSHNTYRRQTDKTKKNSYSKLHTEQGTTNTNIQNQNIQKLIHNIQSNIQKRLKTIQRVFVQKSTNINQNIDLDTQGNMNMNINLNITTDHGYQVMDSNSKKILKTDKSILQQSPSLYQFRKQQNINNIECPSEFINVRYISNNKNKKINNSTNSINKSLINNSNIMNSSSNSKNKFSKPTVPILTSSATCTANNNNLTNNPGTASSQRLMQDLYIKFAAFEQFIQDRKSKMVFDQIDIILGNIIQQLKCSFNKIVDRVLLQTEEKLSQFESTISSIVQDYEQQIHRQIKQQEKQCDKIKEVYNTHIQNMLIKALYFTDKINVMQIKGVVNFQSEARIIDDEAELQRDHYGHPDSLDNYQNTNIAGGKVTGKPPNMQINIKDLHLHNKKYISYSDQNSFQYHSNTIIQPQKPQSSRPHHLPQSLQPQPGTGHQTNYISNSSKSKYKNQFDQESKFKKQKDKYMMDNTNIEEADSRQEFDQVDFQRVNFQSCRVNHKGYVYGKQESSSMEKKETHIINSITTNRIGNIVKLQNKFNHQNLIHSYR